MTIGARAFSADRWDRARRRAVTDAFRRVPFYREQWAVAGHALADPVPTPSASLADDLFRLCPLAHPYRPGAEPSLWTGSPRALTHAVRAVARPAAVVEIRPAVIDWRTLGRGVRYAPALAPDADVSSEGRRHALNRRAALLAARPGTLLIGTPAELTALTGELGGDPVLLPRLTLKAALAPGAPPPPFLVHDPHLGDYAYASPACARIHPLWRRFHLRPSPDAFPLVTDLERTRPTLVDVIPHEPALIALVSCPIHPEPALVRRRRGQL